MNASSSSGYAYTEVLVAAVVVAIAVAPAAEALRSLAAHSVTSRDIVAARYDAQALLETVLTESYAVLSADLSADESTASTRFSDGVGTPHRRLLYVLPYDADNADADDDHTTGAEDGLLRIRVEVPSLGVSMTTVVGDTI